MANAGQPTKRTRHMDTKHFAIQHWVNTDLLILKRIGTNDNELDVMTKNMRRTLFYRYIDYLMGQVIPDYAKVHTDLRLPDWTLKYQLDTLKAGGGSIAQTHVRMQDTLVET